jgi:hypothetical protein
VVVDIRPIAAAVVGLVAEVLCIAAEAIPYAEVAAAALNNTHQAYS